MCSGQGKLHCGLIAVAGPWSRLRTPSGSPGRAFLRLDSDIFMPSPAPHPVCLGPPPYPPGGPLGGTRAGLLRPDPEKLSESSPAPRLSRALPSSRRRGGGSLGTPVSPQTPPPAEGRQRASSPVSRRPVGDSRHPTRGGFRPSRGADKSSSQRQSLSGSQ